MKTSVLVPVVAGILIALLLAPKKADAEFFSGNDLLQRQFSSDTAERISAMGYVMGVFDVYVRVTFCAPNTVTAGQLNDMIKNYLTNNPAIRHRSAESIISDALKQAWPCKSQSKGGGPI
jgi:MFS-type transporter involved in bile tolerance (Atg22 family)